MASSSTNSTKRGKVVGFTLDNINEKKRDRFFWGGLMEKKGTPIFLGGGGLETQGETMPYLDVFKVEKLGK